MQDSALIEKLLTLQYDGDNIFSSVSEDLKVILLSTSEKTYIISGLTENNIILRLEESFTTTANMASHNSVNAFFGKSNGELLRYFDCASVGQYFIYDTDEKQCKLCTENCISCLNGTHCGECDNQYGLDG